jgi:hypothetical protein
MAVKEKLMSLLRRIAGIFARGVARRGGGPAPGVLGAAVLSDSGERYGQIWDVRVDQRSGRIVEAVVGAERLGFLEHLQPVPWRRLRYDCARAAFVARTNPWNAPAYRAPEVSPVSEAEAGREEKAWQVQLAIAHSPFLVLPPFF